MNVNVTGAFIYFTIPIFGGIPITQTLVSYAFVTLILCVACIKLGKNLKTHPDGVQVLVEKGVDMIYGLTTSAMGEHNAHWAPFMGTIFLCSITSSYIGLTGFLRSATADVSCTMVWALMVSGIIWYNNIKNNGFVGWLKGFAEPVAVMTPMNIISEIAQPASMAFRHFGNVAGGGVITAIIYAAFSLLSALVISFISSQGWLVTAVLLAVGVLLGVWAKKKGGKKRLIIASVCGVLGLFALLESLGILTGVPILSVGIPAVLSCYFDLFSGFVQALVFTLLSMVYISGSLPEPEA
jgi:F-type H+-transporting ATPase subunit a